MPTDEERRAANKDILDAHETSLKSAIAIREEAMRERDKYPQASAEWDPLNDLVTNADDQVLRAQLHQAEARARIAAQH